METGDRISELYKGEMFSGEAQSMGKQRIHWICEQVEGQKVIDIGCSQGIASILIAREGFQVIGVDTNVEAIEYANSDWAKEPPEVQQRLTFIRGNIHDVDLPAREFHTAVMGEFLEHQVKPEKAITRVYELLADEGRLIITVPFGLLKDPDHKQTFYIASLYRLIHPYFVISEVEIIGRYWCLLCRRRDIVLEKQMDSIDLALVEKVEREFLQRETALNNDRDAGKKEAAKFKAELDTTKAELNTIKTELNNTKTELNNTKAELNTIESELNTIESELDTTKAELDTIKAELDTTKAELVRETTRLQAELAKEKRKVQAVRGSFSFRLGSMLVRPVRKPGRVVILLTYRLLKKSPDGLKEFIEKVTNKSKMLTSLRAFAERAPQDLFDRRESFPETATLAPVELKRLHAVPEEPDLYEQEKLYLSFLERFKEVVLSRPTYPLVVISSTTRRIGEANRANRTMMFARELAAVGIPVIYVYYRFKGGREFAPYEGGYLLQMPNDFFHRRVGSIATWDTTAERLFICSIPDVHAIPEIGLFRYHGWKIAYEVRDDWEEFYKAGVGKWYDVEYESFLCRQADFFTTVSTILRDKMISMGAHPDRTFLVPNGLGRNFLENARPSFEQRRAGYRGNGTIGYFGSLTEKWFDWNLLLATASCRTDLRFEIIGFAAPKGLNLPRNVAMLGPKNHEQIINVASNWSIAIIPFKKTKLAEGVDPIKIYEYLALGLPCVSCWIPQIKDYPLVFTYHNDSKFEEALDGALKYAPSEDDWARAQAFVAASTWDQRVQMTLSLAGINVPRAEMDI